MQIPVSLFTLLLSVLALTQLTAQGSDTLEIRDKRGEPVVSVVVQVFARAQKMPIDYLISDDEGLACCLPSVGLDSLVIAHLGMGTRTVGAEALTRNGQRWVLTLEEVGYSLPTATIVERVNAIIVNGDTVRFIAEKFRDGREHTLAELLRSMPGLELAADGTMSYQGTPVDQILIDGQDIVRRQFQVLDRLVLPRDLLNAEVIQTSRPDGSLATTLNINTISQAQHRASIEAGLTARRQGQADVSYLRLRPKAWQGLVNVAYDGTGRNAKSGLANIREIDFTLNGIRGDVELLRRSFKIDEPAKTSYFSGQDVDMQASAIKKIKRSSTALFASLRRETRHASGNDEIFGSSTGTPLGVQQLNSNLQRTRSFLNVHHSDTLGGGRFGYFAYASITSEVTENVMKGFTSTAGTPGNFNFIEEYDVRALAIYLATATRLATKYNLHTYISWQRQQRPQNLSLQDTEPLFDSRDTASAGIFELDYELARDANLGTTDVRVRREGLRISQEAGIQIKQEIAEEESVPAIIKGAPSVAYRQEFQHRFIYGQANYHKARQKHMIVAGWQHSVPLDLEQTTMRQGFFFRSNSQIPLPNRYLVRLKLYDFIEAIELDERWRTSVPISTRELSAGLLPGERFGRERQVLGSLLRVDPNGSLRLLSLTLTQKEIATQRQLRLAQGYLINEPVLSKEVLTLAAFAKQSMRIKDHMYDFTARYNRTVGQTREVDPRFLTSSFAELTTYATIRWSKLIHSTFSFEAQHIWQQSEQAALMASFSQAIYQPGASIELRLLRLRYKVSLNSRLGADVQPLYTLDSQIDFQSRNGKFHLKLEGLDLLNYSRSVLENLNLGQAQNQRQVYRRLPGYLSLVGRYTWSS